MLKAESGYGTFLLIKQNSFSIPVDVHCLGKLRFTSPMEKPHLATHSLLPSRYSHKTLPEGWCEPGEKEGSLQSGVRTQRPWSRNLTSAGIQRWNRVYLRDSGYCSKSESPAFHSQRSNRASGAQASWTVTLGLLFINSERQRVGQSKENT